jgi:sulfite exporter TauE/SafE
LSYVASTKEGAVSGLKTYLVFCGVRLAVYVSFGVGAGVVGAWVLHRFLSSAALNILYAVFGAFLGILGLFLILEEFVPQRWRASLRCCHQGRGDLRNVAVFALIVSLAPCAPLLGVLGYIALVSDTWFKGVLYMAAFGVGTVVSPLVVLMFLAGKFAGWLKGRERFLRWVRVASGLIILMLGMWLIMGAGAAARVS